MGSSFIKKESVHLPTFILACTCTLSVTGKQDHLKWLKGVSWTGLCDHLLVFVWGREGLIKHATLTELIDVHLWMPKTQVSLHCACLKMRRVNNPTANAHFLAGRNSLDCDHIGCVFASTGQCQNADLKPGNGNHLPLEIWPPLPYLVTHRSRYFTPHNRWHM